MAKFGRRAAHESFALAIMIPFLVCSGLYLVVGVARDYALARSGVETICRIVSAEVVRHDPDEGRTSYAVEVVFDHEVGSQRYRVEDEGPSSDERIVAEQRILHFPRSAWVRCHRLSWFPRFATVFERDTSSLDFWAPGAFGLLLMCIPPLVYGIGIVKRSRRK